MRRIVLCVAVASVLALVPAMEAAAAPDGQFACRATALRIGGTEVGTSNRPGIPCQTDQFAAIPINLPLGPIQIAVLGVSSATQSNSQGGSTGFGVGGNAQAGALGITIRLGQIFIQLGAVRNLNAVVCGPGDDPPALVASEQNDTVGLTIQNTKIQLSQPLTIPLGILTLHINREQRTPNSLVTRAVEITSPILPNIVIAESIVGFTGNPCRDAPVIP